MVEDLQALVGKRGDTLPLSHLPFAQLRRKLEQEWQPSAASILEPGSITIDLLSGALTFGIGTVTWPGGTRLSSILTVAHGLGRTPTIVQLTSNNEDNITLQFNTLSPTGFLARANTVDGSFPLAGTARTFAWLAM